MNDEAARAATDAAVSAAATMVATTEMVARLRDVAQAGILVAGSVEAKKDGWFEQSDGINWIGEFGSIADPDLVANLIMALLALKPGDLGIDGPVDMVAELFWASEEDEDGDE